eukprot:TRINITY_DN2202_c0_g2_i2.p1 TRINITY_DN2202_c0_g2~~TRINITY_DN2202_c0_g2_i2.p1  ORF type:complete len:242 (-),score=52.60 TRINITY_DN2202_c0_g2_i2:24-722(-)
MSAYDFSLTTFSPSGKLVQIEYALHAMRSGGQAVAIRAKNGVVMVTEKKLPALMDATTLQKISNLSEGLGMVYAGIGPDSRVLVRSGRKAAERYFLQYRESMPTAQMVKELATLMQEYTQQGGVRPFGVSLLVAGYDEKGPQLYQVDPSGSFWGWKASAIGKNMANAKTFLEKRFHDDIELDDAIHTALLALREGFEGQMDENNIEVGIIGKDKKFQVLSPIQVKEYLDVIA